MDHHVSERPAKYRCVLLHMRRDARPGLDMLYLSGFAETLAVIERQNALSPGSHDLSVSDIACVLRAWGDFEGDSWAGGFVLELTNSRRVYVESYADGPGWGTHCRVSVSQVSADSAFPKLPPGHDSGLYGWVEDLSKLGDYLRRLGYAAQVG